MTDDEEPQFGETGFFKTVHDAVEEAIKQYNTVVQYNSQSSRERDYFGPSIARNLSWLLTLYISVIFPHDQVLLREDPENAAVKRFREEWESINKKYGDNFEKSGNVQSFSEAQSRFRAIMNHLTDLGITRIRERGEQWQDAFINYFEEELRK
ncbi:MAG: hypothetical protein QW393_04670 [Candidatus Micrarchaeaceae archaeon]